MAYQTFTRTWWDVDANGKKTPKLGRSTNHEQYETEAEARDACSHYNRTHPPGPRGHKMEYRSS